VPVLEGDPTQDQACQHQQNQEIKRRHHYGIDERKGSPQDDAGDDQPGFAAVPHRRNGAHHGAPSRLVAGQTEQDSDSEIEAVEQNVEKRAQP
jgi:hypothetical protein